MWIWNKSENFLLWSCQKDGIVRSPPGSRKAFPFTGHAHKSVERESTEAEPRSQCMVAVQTEVQTPILIPAWWRQALSGSPCLTTVLSAWSGLLSVRSTLSWPQWLLGHPLRGDSESSCFEFCRVGFANKVPPLLAESTFINLKAFPTYVLVRKHFRKMC